MSDSDRETRAAFITAALVLMVMPMVFVVGLAALLLFMRLADVPLGRSLLITASTVWGVIVLVGVLIAARVLIRRSAQS